MRRMLVRAERGRRDLEAPLFRLSVSPACGWTRTPSLVHRLDVSPLVSQRSRRGAVRLSIASTALIPSRVSLYFFRACFVVPSLRVWMTSRGDLFIRLSRSRVIFVEG